MKAFVAVFLPLLLAYSGTWLWCAERWNAPTMYFQHCWLLPFVFVVVVWQRRAAWRTQPASIDGRALWLLVPALLLHFVGVLLLIDSLSAASLVLAVPAAGWFALGRARLRGLWPALWLVLFLVPLPIFVEGRLAFTLKELAVDAGSWLANVLGADVVRSGDLLQPRGSTRGLFVADACSGLRSLLAMSTLAYCLAFFVGPPTWRRRLVLLVCAAPLAIVANIVRIAVLCLGASWVSLDFAEGTGHTIANVVEWLSLLVLLQQLHVWLSRGREAVPPAAIPPAAMPPAAIPAEPMPGEPMSTLWRWPVRASICLWLATVPLVWLSFVRPAVAIGDRAARLPEVIADYRLLKRSDAAEAKFQRDLPRMRELLGTDDFVWRYYEGPNHTYMNVVLLFHDHNWKSVHPPRICIEGSNMFIEQDTLVTEPRVDTDAVVSRIVARERTSGSRFVTLSVFGTADWLSGDYWAFAWHHLPLALLRRNDSGFLLRVESKIGAGETEAEAEARCAGFLRASLPLARELLR